MTWAVILGSPHGGLLPIPQLDDFTSPHYYSGDLITLTGSGITPGSQAILEPSNVVVGNSNPTITSSIQFIVPYGLPNVKHKLYVTNGNKSNKIDLFVIRDVTLTPATSTITNVTAAGMN